MITNWEVLRREISSLCDALGQTFVQMDASADGSTTFLANIDNSIISRYIIPQSSEANLHNIDDAVDRDLSVLAPETFRLYSRYWEQSPIRIVISLPTVIELAISLINVGNKLTRSADSLDKHPVLYDNLMRRLNIVGKKDDVPLSNDEIYRLTNQIFSLIPSVTRSSQAPQFLSLIQKGAVGGFGRYYNDIEYQQIKRRLLSIRSRVVGFLDAHRKRRDGEAPYDFHFRNNIDALNFAMSYSFDRVRDNTNVSFAGPFPAYLDKVSRDEDHYLAKVLEARTNPATLFLQLRAKEVTEKLGNPSVEARNFLQVLADRAETCRNYLLGVDSLTSLGDSRMTEVYLFYEDYMRPLFGEKKYRRNDDTTLQRARELFTDKAAFRERFHKTSAELDAVVNTVLEIEPVLNSDEMITDFGLLDDPRVRTIRERWRKNQLGVK